MIGGGFVYGIKYKLFHVLVRVADPKFIGIKPCRFGLVLLLIVRVSWLSWNQIPHVLSVEHPLGNRWKGRICL